MLSNHVDLVENEIKNLLNETKKKYNNIKEVILFLFFNFLTFIFLFFFK